MIDILVFRDYGRSTLHNDREKNKMEVMNYVEEDILLILRQRNNMSFFVYICSDEFGFYAQSDVGNEELSHHYPIKKTPRFTEKNDSDKEMDSDINDMSQCQASKVEIQKI